jgi:alpha-beta hydrolase superfamily lysophospholipase
MKGQSKVIKLRDGVEIYSEVHEAGKPIWLIGTHGIGEHLGRHDYLVDLFGHEMNVFRYDLRGHGRSKGQPAYIKDFSQYAHDLKELLIYLKTNFKMEKFIIFGHSMGALISCDFLQNLADDDLYPEKIYINAPPVGIPGALGKIVNFLPVEAVESMTKIPFSAKLGGLVDLKALSHNAKIKEDYVADEFNQTKLHSKLCLELVKASKKVFARPVRPKCPAYCTYGSGDRVICPDSLNNYFSMVEKAFNVHEIEDAYHEIHNEIEKYRVPYFDYLKECLLGDLYS